MRTPQSKNHKVEKYNNLTKKTKQTHATEVFSRHNFGRRKKSAN